MASKIIPTSLRALSRCRRRALHQQALPISPLAPARIVRAATNTQPNSMLNTTVRLAHSIPRPPAAAAAPKTSSDQAAATSAEINTNSAPSYELTFTCIPCGQRSAHTISKQGYHHGSVLITCPSCRNRHVISDHLGIFGQSKVTIEDIMRDKGMLVKRGTLGQDGDLEFWEDGSITSKTERQGDREGQDPKPKAKRTGGDTNGDAPGTTFGKA